MGRDKFPLPDRVCEYGTRQEFDDSRPESGQWVFWRDRVDLILAGRYHDVVPLHVELSPTYLCNFGCPWCSCRSAREDWSDEDVFNHPNATPRTVMDPEKLNAVLGNLATHGIGIQWVGGEPTMHPALYTAVGRANEFGLKQCLFTNGSLLSPLRLNSLFDGELVFVRVSLDAVTKEIHETHHGYSPNRGYYGRVLQCLENLITTRIERHSPTMVGVSVVVDERNLADVGPTAEYIRDCCRRHGPGAIDFAIFRPTYQFYTSQVELSESTGTELRQLVERGSQIAEMLGEVGVKVVVPSESFLTVNEDSIPEEFGDSCLSCGWFGEITPNGDMVVCSDQYGNPDSFIGNVASSSVSQIWQGQSRLAVIDRVEQRKCFRKECPRNGRGFHLNRVFHTIERFRAAGKMGDVKQWIEDLRSILQPPSHSFFL